MSLNVAFFGGKFDPPHLGHQLTIFLALEKYMFDEVWLIPSFLHPFGYKPIDFDLRVEMCRIMARPWQNRVKISEIERNMGEKTSYTVDIIEYFVEEFPENNFSLLIGEDNWKVRDKWKDFGRIEALCKKIMVIGRGLNEENSFSLPDISSTLVKKMVKEGKNPDNFLPAGIYEYIKEHNLYL